MALTTAKEEYNRIALAYKKTKGRVAVQHALYYSFFDTVGDVCGKDVIDLACGAGFSTRMIACWQHRRLVGVDISDQQIRLAKRQEINFPMGIDFYKRNIAASAPFKKLGKFDIATAVFLLNYAISQQSLNKILLNVRNLLKEGGKFIGIIPNPNIGIMYRGYGIEFSPINDIQDGARYKVKLFDQKDKLIVSFTNYWYSMKTYKEAFFRAKFSVKFFPIRVSREGIKEFGKKFWHDLNKRPSHLVFIAKTK
jgi:toxoflavin synthase